MPLGRRRYPRVNTSIPVELVDTTGTTWTGTSVNLSAGGLKVRGDAPIGLGDSVRMFLRLPDIDAGISVACLALRKDPDGIAFLFGVPDSAAMERIRSYVSYLLPRQPLKVVIIEDDRSVANVLSELFRSEGHETFVAESAETGLDIIERVYPDAILVDLYLPSMSGLQLLRLLAEQGRLPPVLVISGLASEEEARECLNLGVIEFLHKPIRLQRFLQVLNVLELRVVHARLAEATQN